MRRQRGFGVIAAIVVLVILATLSAAIVALSSTQSQNLSQDILSARAEQAARAGVEWGLYRAFSDATAWNGDTVRCSAASATEAAPVTATVNLAAVNGFQATVRCWSKGYGEGETAPNVSKTIRLYQITSIACPVGGDCPRTGANTASMTYVERRREAAGIF